jgi:hypothetical protein
MFQYGDNSTALYHVAVILDPLSETAQRWSSLLEVCVFLSFGVLKLTMSFKVAHEHPGYVHRGSSQSSSLYRG